MTEIEKAIRERLTSPDFLPSTRVLAVTSAQPENLVLAPFRLVAIIDAERAEVRRLRETSDRQAQELRACATEKEEAERAHALEVRRLSEELATVTGQRDAARKAYADLVEDARNAEDAQDFVLSLIQRGAQ